MNDLKELLPLAAKACGVEGELGETLGGHPCIVTRQGAWRPQLDSGDGAEMEDKLRISVIRTAKDYVTAEHMELTKMMQERIADHPTEGHARRWASLRVAAEIGRSMK